MQKKNQKTLTGKVTSKSGNKSLKIAIEYKIKHPRYSKYIKRKINLGVHDEHNQAGIGDIVSVTQCKPRSKTKSWRLVRVLEKAARV